MTDILDRLATALAGRYRLDREIGAGGMAVVYLAHDERHDRRVAVKVLRPELSAILGAERFLQEIKVTANLQHSHILPLYDSGAADGLLFYVMPYVEGETLRDRLEREKQLPVDVAVRLTVQVASALEYAHKRNVIHRDIKPENILLRDGDALVADFGIALAVRNAGGNRMTETGLSLGTPQYMSPEQATADRELNACSDIYSLGCVLYEMLAGEPPHTGRTAQAIIARLMTEDPRRVTISRPTVPTHVEVALHTALQRLPADRFASAAEFADALVNPVAATRARAGVAGFEPRAPARRRGLLVGAAVVALAVLGVWRLAGRASAPVEPLRRFTLVLPDSAPLWLFPPSYLGEGRAALTLSPDGRTLVYTARVRGNSILAVRALDRDSVRLLAGTNGASDPVFSPDGDWVAFVTDGALKKVSLADGRVLTLASIPVPWRLGWVDRDRIIVRDFFQGSLVVPASGGAGVRLSDTTRLSSPRAGPGSWLIGIFGGIVGGRVALWDPAAQRRHPVTATPGDTTGLVAESPLYARSGHVLFVQDSTLMALPIDPGNHHTLGPAAPMFTGLRHESIGAVQMTIADDGTLAFVRGGSGSWGHLVWTSQAGRVLDSLAVPWGEYTDFNLSPDGHLLWLVSRAAGGRFERRLIDLRTGLSRAMPDGDEWSTPNWWPDSKRIAVNANGHVIVVTLSGVQRIDTLLSPGWHLHAVSPDTSWLAVSGPSPDSSGLWLLGHGTRVSVQSAVSWPGFSPDGRWLVNKGTDGLYVSPVPATGELVKIAPLGADEPEWSARGDRVIYRSGARWYAVPVTTAGGFHAGEPTLLFQARFLQSQKSWHLGPDGRLLVLQGSSEETVNRVEVITNFFAELHRLAPPR